MPLLVDPLDVDALARAMRQLLDDDTLRCSSVAVPNQFSWTACICVLSVIESVTAR
jgi:glycosyltransferase involved in cell wall biosynthesis